MQNFIDAYSWINIRFLLEGLWITIEVSVISIIISFFDLTSENMNGI